LGTIAHIKGKVIRPGDPAYDETRAVLYGGIDKRPSIIVRAADVEDVRAAVLMARDERLELAVRSGGHSIAGHSTTEGGIVLDLRDMSRIDVDMNNRTATAEAGATAVKVTEATNAHGLAVGFGDAGSVGISGITLGGGIGFLVRKHGLTIDSLLSAELVTADGRIIQTDSETHPDLFWAIRGGGGNFGVVTRLQFRLHDVSQFTGGMLILPATPDTIAGFVAASFAAPEELTTIGNVMFAPPMPFLPKEVHGRLVVFAMLAYVGDADSAARAVAPFRQLATPLVDMVKPMPYVGMYPPEDPNLHPTVIGRTLFVDTIDKAASEMILDFLSKSDASMRVAQLRVLGGASARIPSDATAYAHRLQPMMVNVAAFYEGDEDRAVREVWVSAFSKALQPHDAAGYVNFLGNEGEARIRAAFPGSTWDRLAKIKATYDPTNLFRLNQNVPPAPAGRELTA
jgi:FAD/FMN-containing dehydrogenase